MIETALPVVLAVAGGIIAYFVLRDTLRDARRALDGASGLIERLLMMLIAATIYVAAPIAGVYVLVRFVKWSWNHPA